MLRTFCSYRFTRSSIALKIRTHLLEQMLSGFLSSSLMLNIGMEDMLHTRRRSLLGFLKTLAFQVRVIKQRLVRRGHLDHRTESWHMLHFT